MSKLKDNFEKQTIPALMTEFEIKNRMAVPKLQKVVVNVGFGRNLLIPKYLEKVSENLAAITGQKPVLRRSRKAISGFKVRENDPVGLCVTLRGVKMYDFVEKLANITLPRLRDFRGLEPKCIDKRGNYTLGIKEQIIFPEITHEKAELIHGLEVTMVINSDSVKISQKILEYLGFPFVGKKILSAKEQNG